MYNGWFIAVLEAKSLSVRGVAMYRGLECQREKWIEERGRTDIEWRSTVRQLLTQTVAQYVSKLPVF